VANKPKNKKHKLNKHTVNTKFTFLLQLKAKPGKEAEVESFLQGEAKLVSKEPGTITWHAAKDESEPGSYFVFDTFNDEAAREAHMNGEAGQEFVANKDRLFSGVKIHRLAVVAQK
jgi:quinol monooxygenase YgiN